MLDNHLTKAELKEQRKMERQEFEQNIKNQESRDNFKKLIFWFIGAVLLIGVVVLIAIFAGGGSSSNPTTNQTNNIKFEKLDSNDLEFGPKNSKVTLVEYADFQCPACGAYYPMIKQLLSDFNGQMLYVYRFMPLTTIHQNALISAKASYAAYKSGKFLEMEDLLFTNQKDWAEVNDPTSIFISYAESLGIDKNKFSADMNANSTGQFILAQQQRWINDGVNSTPTFAINGKIINNPTSYEEFKKDIQNAMR